MGANGILLLERLFYECSVTQLYNTVRPHSSLRYLTPEEFAESLAPRPASPPTPMVSIEPAWAGSDVQEPESANF